MIRTPPCEALTRVALVELASWRNVALQELEPVPTSVKALGGLALLLRRRRSSMLG
jgi:hypothetical protein